MGRSEPVRRRRPGVGLVLLGAVAACLSGCSAPPRRGPFSRGDGINSAPATIAPLPLSEMSEAENAALARLRGRTRLDDETMAYLIELSPMVATMLRHPRLYAPHLEMGYVLLREGRLAARDRELAILRIAWLCQAPFEWGTHVPAAKAAGFSDEEIDRVRTGPTAGGWSAHDRTTLLAVDELLETAMIADATWSSLESEFDEVERIELVLLVGHYQMTAYYQNALRLPLHRDSAPLPRP